jgi:hypothetical protein
MLNPIEANSSLADQDAAYHQLTVSYGGELYVETNCPVFTGCP